MKKRNPKIHQKHEFDAMLASELGLPQKKVREITSNFLALVMDALTDLDVVQLEGFGRFLVNVEDHSGRKALLPVLRAGYPNLKNPPKEEKQVVRVQRKIRVHFKKSEVFNRILREKHGPSGTQEARHGKVRSR